MRLLFVLVFAFIVCNLSAQKWIEMMKNPDISFFDTQKEFYKTLAEDSTGKIHGFKQFKRWEYFMMDRVDSDGFFRNHNATNNYYEVNIANSTAKGSNKLAGNWTQLGPFGPSTGSGSGRTNCIAFHPTNSNIILVGSASGGLWRSVDGGSTWSTNTDGLENLGFSDIVFSQSDPTIVYAATGDKDGGDTYSVGVLKSVDGGLSWQTTGMQFTPDAKRKIYKLLVNPTNDSILIMASTTGLRKSVDGGNNWVLMRAGSFVDAVFKPNNPNTIYAATNTIVIRSTDGGQTWTNLTIPLASSSGRLTLAVTAADTNYLYVLSSLSSNNGYNGVYRSTDGGNSFVARSTSPNLLGWNKNGNDSGGQGWYDLSLAVSQSNANLVFVGGVNIWKSTNGGTSWTLSGHWTASGAPYVHADIHEIKFSPHAVNTLWACTDGGLSISTANGTNWAEKNTNLSIAQMYRLGGSATVASKIITGWQDNGTNYNNNSNWDKVIGGDGMECLIDYSNNNYMYGSLYYGDIRRTTNAGANWTGITDDLVEDGAWVTPFVQDPLTPATIYVGLKNIYKSTNRGNSWTAISTFGTSQNINALAVAPSNPLVIYAANSTTIWKTIDGGQNWSNITIPGGNAFRITYIAVHPTNPARLWVSISGFSAAYKVFQSDDGGLNWTNITGTLPNLPANTIVYEKNSPDGIYVGMDVGVFYRDTVLGEWVPFMQNLPNVIVKELEIYYPNQTIRAATFGRGLWESPLYHLANGVKNTNNENLESFYIGPNPSTGIVNIRNLNTQINDTKIEVFNASGQLILNAFNSNSNNYILDLNNIPKGLYIIRIKSKNLVISKKIIIM